MLREAHRQKVGMQISTKERASEFRVVLTSKVDDSVLTIVKGSRLLTMLQLSEGGDFSTLADSHTHSNSGRSHISHSSFFLVTHDVGLKQY